MNYYDEFNKLCNLLICPTNSQQPTGKRLNDGPTADGCWPPLRRCGWMADSTVEVSHRRSAFQCYSLVNVHAWHFRNHWKLNLICEQVYQKFISGPTSAHTSDKFMYIRKGLLYASHGTSKVSRVHSFSGDEKLPHHMEFKLKVAHGVAARMRKSV